MAVQPFSTNTKVAAVCCSDTLFSSKQRQAANTFFNLLLANGYRIGEIGAFGSMPLFRNFSSKMRHLFSSNKSYAILAGLDGTAPKVTDYAGKKERLFMAGAMLDVFAKLGIALQHSVDKIKAESSFLVHGVGVFIESAKNFMVIKSGQDLKQLYRAIEGLVRQKGPSSRT